MILVLIVTAVITVWTYLKLTIGKCKSEARLDGKTVIVTGANTGIGFEAAKDLARRGARVVLACRDPNKGACARDEIVRVTGNKDVIVKQLDFTSLKSVREFAADILTKEKRIDILVNNAGVGGLGNTKSEDGLQLGLQVNHFGPFLLTNLLLSRLRESAPSRIIMVSSIAHKYANIDLNNINMEGDWDDALTKTIVYNNSKLMNIFFANELTRRLNGTDVTANSLHPGVVLTDMFRMMPTPMRVVAHFLVRLFGKSAVEGAQTTIYLAVAPEVENVSGQYFADCKPSSVDLKASDAKFSKLIWEFSEKAVKLQSTEIHSNTIIN